MMGCCSQRCQSLPQNWHRPGWITLLLVTSVSFLLFPILKSVAYHLHAALTGGYVSGTHSLALINCPNEQIAKDIARGILEKRLAASVNVLPKSSALYIWREEIEESSEVLLMVKTRTAMIEELAEYVRFVHPFETPDFLTVPIDKENPAYFRWMEEVLS